MRHDESMGAVVASPGELASAVAAMGLSFGDLAPSWLTGATPAPVEGAAPEGDGAVLLEAGLRAMADPARLLVGQATVADAVLRSFTLAWDRESAVVAMAGAGPEGVALTALVPERAFAFLAASVGLAGPMSAAPYRPALSARATLALVALADAFRAATMRAALAHAAPSGSVSAPEVAQALADAVTDDARWLVPFLGGVLPFGVDRLLPAGDLDAALAELVDAGAVELLPGDDTAPTLIELTDAGALLVDGLTHDSARVALTLTEVEDGAIRWETVLLVRSADGLWLADLTGAGGSVARLAHDEATALLLALTGIPQPEAADAAPEAAEPEPAATPAHAAPAQAAPAQEAPALTVVTCPHCGAAAYREYGECPACRGRFT